MSEMLHGRTSLWVERVGIDVYFTHCTCQVKPHSSPWLSAVSPAVIVQRNQFFGLYHRNKSSEFIVKLRQPRVLETAKVAYAAKTIESITSQKLDCRDFWRVSYIWTLQNVSEIVLFSRLLEGLIGGPFI